jgi:hypothetical protein
MFGYEKINDDNSLGDNLNKMYDPTHNIVVETYHMLIRKIDTYKYKCEFANIFI